MEKRYRIHVIFGVLAVIAVGILVAFYFRYGVQRVDKGMNLLLIVLGVAVAAIAIDFLQGRARNREKIIQRFYFSSDGIYNYEIGYAPFERVNETEDALQFATFAAVSLVNMSYGFDVVEPPEDFKPEFILTTEKLKFHRVDNEEDGAVVIDVWQGKLLRMETPGDETKTEVVGAYKNARELAYLLEEHGNMF